MWPPLQTPVSKGGKSVSKINFGVTVPVVDVGGDAETLRRFAKEAEDIGYHHLAATDHVIGVNAASRPNWDIARNTSDDWKRAAAQWVELGVTHITLNNVRGRYHHKRIAETSLDAHMRAMENYWAVVEEFAVT